MEWVKLSFLAVPFTGKWVLSASEVLEVDKDLEWTFFLGVWKPVIHLPMAVWTTTGIPDHLSSPVTLGTETGIVCVKDVVRFIFLLGIRKLKLLGGVFFLLWLNQNEGLWLVFMILELRDFFNDASLNKFPSEAA